MPQAVHDTFSGNTLNTRWRPWQIGTGTLAAEGETLYCRVHPTAGTQAGTHYSDAQITDYHGLPRSTFPWRPPVRLTVRAWMSHPPEQISGTAGFGFWNEPFVPVGRQWPRLPRAVWFFLAGPPNNMALARGVPGYGWKAATIDAARWSFLALAPFAPLGFLAMRSARLYRWLWPLGQRAIGVSEALLPVAVTEPHDYELDWLRDGVIFRVDGTVVHRAVTSPRGPLGFIAWMDNQYAVVTPQGRFGFGLVTVTQTQWLALDSMTIQPLGDSP